MIFMMFFLGVLTILAGILPFLSSLAFVPSAITAGPIYYSTIIVIGAGGLLYALLNQLLMPMHKFVEGSLGLITLLGGILPLANNYVNLVPETFVTGWVYALIIIGVGIIGLLYGATQI